MSSRSRPEKEPVAADRDPGPGRLRLVNLRRPSALDRSFCWEACKGLLSFRYELHADGGGGRAPLERRFFGVGLALPSNAEEAERVCEWVRELGVGSVRVDFSTAQDRSVAEEFIGRLHGMGLEIVLHLVQPIERARVMTTAEAKAEWRDFLEGSVAPLLANIEALEVGSTINRAKWSGYTLEGFLETWGIAYEFCRQRSCLLVGPNVTDFEPQYNAGVLGILAKRKQLPDIHSNNLFAERAIEPEAPDHKILGAALKHFHGYDLKKKASLVASIARRQGVARNWSPCAFWTIPRIRRYLAAAEEQVSDYLVRYYVLCLSEGSFERIFWGPLVSYREGLCDDGTADRMSSDGRDVVAFYSAYPGEVSKWRRRPAYHAMRGLIDQLEGYRYVSAIVGGRGLEIHQFAAEERSCVVAWTMNGRLARLRDCFGSDCLRVLRAVRDSDGRELPECPDFITQSPVFLHWDGGLENGLGKSAGCLPDVVAARPPEGARYFDFEEDRWRGCVLTGTREEADLLIAALRPEAISRREETASLRKSRNAIWTVEDPRDCSRLLVVKKPIRMAWHKRMLDRNKPSKALRSWNGTSELMRRGINTPKVVAYFESKAEGALMNNWFICEHIDSKLSVRSFFSRYAAGADEVEGFGFENFTEQLVGFVFRMHQTGIYFRDLAGGNVLVEIGPGRDLIFSLIDTARIRCLPFGMDRRRRLADLKRLVLKLNGPQQIHFMNAYLQRTGSRFSWSNRIGFKLFAFKVRLKRIKRRLRKKLSA